MIVLIFALIALAIALVYAFGFSAVTGLADIWKPLLMFLGSFVAINALYLLVMWFIGLPVKAAPRARQSEICRVAGVSICSFVLGHCWTRVHTEGLEKLPKDSRFLLVCNHRSSFDPLATMWALRDYNVSFISKPSNLKIPIVGRLAWGAGYLPINREDNREALKTILQAAEYLKNDVCSMCIYPEGTRSHGTAMLPFHSGSFKIAQKAGVPLVIASIEGTENVTKNVLRRPTRVTLKILEVIDAAEVKAEKTNTLADHSVETIQAAIA